MTRVESVEIHYYDISEGIKKGKRNDDDDEYGKKKKG